jgi:hypothetical protein
VVVEPLSRIEVLIGWPQLGRVEPELIGHVLEVGIAQPCCEITG